MINKKNFIFLLSNQLSLFVIHLFCLDTVSAFFVFFTLILKLFLYFHLQISCRSNGEEATGYFWQKISPALEYALQIKFNQKKAATNFSAGVKYALDSDNSVKVCMLRVWIFALNSLAWPFRYAFGILQNILHSYGERVRRFFLWNTSSICQTYGWVQWWLLIVEYFSYWVSFDLTPLEYLT